MRVTIAHWNRYQHYSSRRPPWVKLHRSLLDDRAFSELSDYASKLLIQLWLIASESEDGTITGDIEDIAFRVHRDRSEVFPALQELAQQGFIGLGADDASAMLAERLQVAPESAPETETEKRESRRRTYPQEFTSVWNLHRRGPKAKAYEQYKKAVGEVITHDELVKALGDYVKTLTPDFQGVHLFRYIRDARWEEAHEVPGVLKRNIVTSSTMRVVS